jgi:asparagine synthase (glutamine-hydrolysing)
MWVVFNGEIFNYLELRQNLEKLGHQFSTHSDTEVLVHLYQQYGPQMLKQLNGQFALALWDRQEKTLFLARDRVGIRPLFYTLAEGRFVFASEVKALLAAPGVRIEISPDSLAEAFTYWAPLSPCSVFTGIQEVPPGSFLCLRDGIIDLQQWWNLDFTDESPARASSDYVDELESLLIDATRIRLRSDVPVGAYLSGGLDSSLTSAIIRKYTGAPLDTFSIRFSDPNYDETSYQEQMAQYLGTQHQTVYVTPETIGQAFPETIWHTEVPILRTAPAPLLLLSALVHANGYKVVMTGEGADEILAGYDIFKEMKIRRFWARRPESQIRPLLLRRLYPEINGLNSANQPFAEAFFKKGMLDIQSPLYSHTLRWQNTARTLRFFTKQETELGGDRLAAPPALPPDFQRWTPLGQAQYLEFTTFLSTYLLSSQGDRVAMAHSVEGRYPFLDYRVIEFAGRLPANLKMRGLTEKWLLRRVGEKLAPAEIWRRRKRPYRAPIQHSFFPASPLDYVGELLSESAIKQSGYFNPDAVTQLARKAASPNRLSEVDEMALSGILSTQLIHRQFIQGFTLRPPDRHQLKRLVDYCS